MSLSDSTTNLIESKGDQDFEYSNFWFIRSTVKSMTPQQVIESFVGINLYLTVLETFFLLPFYLLVPGLLGNYMSTIIPWIMVIMVLVNLSQLITAIHSHVKVKKGDFVVSRVLAPLGYAV